MDLYEEEYAPDRPVVCFDETSRQLVRDSRPGIGVALGQVERYDYEYERNGTRNLFVFCEPKAGYRHVEVTKRRTGVDFAEQPAYVLTCRPGGRTEHLLHTQRGQQTAGDGALHGHKPRASMRRRGNVRSVQELHGRADEKWTQRKDHRPSMDGVSQKVHKRADLPKRQGLPNHCPLKSKTRKEFAIETPLRWRGMVMRDEAWDTSWKGGTSSLRLSLSG